jgi:hypothetical protein
MLPDLVSTCSQCVSSSLKDASGCASIIQQPTTQPTQGPVQSQTAKFQAPTKLEGSKFPERLALSTVFLEKQQLTETLASLPLTQKIALGFKQNDLIVDCTFDGVPCDETLVKKSRLRRNRIFSFEKYSEVALYASFGN